MTKLKILIILCSIFLSFSLYGDNDEHKHEHKKHHIYKNLDYLDLNEDQYQNIRKILIDYRKKYKKFYKDKLEQEQELQELIKKEKFDKEEYKSIVKKTYQKAIELEAETLEQIHSILTPRQRSMFSYYLQEWRVE